MVDLAAYAVETKISGGCVGFVVNGDGEEAALDSEEPVAVLLSLDCEAQELPGAILVNGHSAGFEVPVH